ncbi:MAG: helix-turn-helix domain-containing protein [Saprospiraceae bacterium]|nr:helix-turn-helix domain-containing protein [Lewinella sp.]
MKHADDLNQDDVFLQKLTQIVLDNLENEQFSVEHLSDQIGMSRSHLFRKIKTLRGQSVSQFIRQIRLERAMELLQNNVATSSEIAYRVGFSSPSYFNKCFHDHYGFSPGEVRKQAAGGDFFNIPDDVSSKQTQPENTTTDVPSDKGGWKKWVLTAVILLILLIVGWYLLAPSTDLSDTASIAILPLRYPVSDPEQEYLAVGLHDALIGAVGQISALRVISRTSTLRYRDEQKLLPEIATELGVSTILEGSVLGAGDSAHIQLQLIDVFPRERQIWSKEYPIDLRHILEQQSDMVRNIAREIHVRLTPREQDQLARTPMVDPEAYKAYMKGKFYWDKLTEKDLNTSMKYFELALRIDSTYALAYSGIALVWVGRMQQGLSSYFEGGAQMKIAELKTKMFALGQDLSDVHFLLGGIACWVEYDYEKAEKELRHAIDLNPNASTARAYLSHVLNIRHKPEEAMEQIDKAIDLDPFNPLFRALYGMDLLYARQFDKAINILTKTLEKAPTDPVALSTLRTAYHMTGQYDEALEIWKTSYAAREDQEAVAVLMRGAQQGGYQEALKQLAELLIHRSETTYVTPWQIGTLYTRAGMKEEALEWLEKAYEAHDNNMPYIGVDPIFDIFHSDPRFQDLLKHMNLPLRPHPLAKG